MDTVAERFDAKWISEPNTGCHLWASRRDRYGYGTFNIRYRRMSAHRVAWEMRNGPIAHGLCVCHKCDTPACVNPDHLFLGTPADNNAYMRRKGRGTIPSNPLNIRGKQVGPVRCFGDRNGMRTTPSARPRGERNGSAKLTSQDVSEMRARRGEGATLCALARDFGVHVNTVCKITRGASWKG